MSVQPGTDPHPCPLPGGEGVEGPVTQGVIPYPGAYGVCSPATAWAEGRQLNGAPSPAKDILAKGRGHGYSCNPH
jgi:hypothetical protein